MISDNSFLLSEYLI